jgi:uncharacterized membrane protein
MNEQQELQQETQPAILFENRYVITKATLKEWEKIAFKFMPFTRLVLIALNSVTLLATVWCFYYGVVSGRYIYYICSVIMGGTLVRSVLMFFFEYHFRYKRVMKMTNGEKWEATFRFTDTHIEVNDCNASSSRPYGQVLYVRDLDGCFLFYTDDGNYFIRKDSFTVGEADEFGEFLLSKCCEEKPLMTGRRFRMRAVRPLSWLIVITVFLGVIFIPLSLDMLGIIDRGARGTAFEQLSVARESELHIATVEIPDGAVTFCAELPDTIHADLYRRSGDRYRWTKGHNYSLTYLVGHNKYDYLYSGELFEDDDMAFAVGGAVVLYSVAEKEWWDNLVSDSVKEQYTTAEFELGTGEFVLYYRIGEK